MSATIHAYPSGGETHFAVHGNNGEIIALCNYESSAILVRDDDDRKNGVRAAV